MRALRVIVVGGGIGGMAAAIALHRGGHDVEVWERAADIGEAGSGLTLWPNGLRALDAIGVGARVRSRAMADTEGGIRDRSGRWLTRTDTGKMAERYGPVVAVHRADLFDILRTALGDDRLRLGRTVTGIDIAGSWETTASGNGGRTGDPAPATRVPGHNAAEDETPEARDTTGDIRASNGGRGPDTAADAREPVRDVPAKRAASERGGRGARVLYAGGAETADLVIGADGLRSVVRAAVCPRARPPRYAGYTAWRMVTAPRPELRQGGQIWGSGEIFGIVPLSDHRVYMFGAVNAAEGERGADGEFAEVHRRFGEWPDPVPRLLAAVSPESVMRHDIYELPDLPTFVRGPVALLGDAAHAMTPNMGQGANLALEDAATLAALLDDRGVEDALRGYDSLRRPRTRALAHRSRRIGTVAQWSWAPAVRARDTALRLMPGWAMLRAFDRALDWNPPR
ncbi:monooxygenase [Nocardia nova]|uniref:Monooxygenase n=2 Tax=Nocardia TaxID=1817 RepID=A0A2T2Z2H8_9NOCA|nr:FAD-dependent monooxygenase [Nocardia nova]PSR61960.1 monooxygenase [Nocardia nova]